MMADDVLRLRATLISDDALANLRKLERGMREVGARGAPGIKALNTEMQKFSATIKAIGVETESKLVPGMFRLVAMAGPIGRIVAAIAAAATAAQKFSAYIVAMNAQARSIGVTVGQLKAMQNAAEKAGVSVEGFTATLRDFGSEAAQMKYKVGSLYETLTRLNKIGLRDKIMAEKDPAKQLALQMEDVNQVLKEKGPGIATAYARMIPGFDISLIGMDPSKITDAKKNAITAYDDLLDRAKQIHGAWVDTKDTIQDIGAELSKQSNDLAKFFENWKQMQDQSVKGLPEFGKRAVPRLRDPNFKPTSFGDDSGGDDDASRIMQKGVFDALVQFQSYLSGGGGAGSGTGFTNASYSPGGGPGGGGSPGFHSGGGYTVQPGGGGTMPRSVGGGTPKGLPGTGAMGGMVHGHPVDPYGGQTGQKLFEPMSGTMGGGVGGHSAKFGPNMHEGVDIMGPVGSKVFAVKPGVVVNAPRQGGGLDQVLTIRHADGTYSRYLHQGYSGAVKVGDNVTGGQVVGSSGYRNAPHTHFEMWTGQPGKSALMNPKAIFGWDAQHPAVGGRETTARGPGSTGVAGPTGGGGSANDRKTVKGSWFGNAPGWVDKSEPKGSPKSNRPGIALPSGKIGEMYEVTTPDGRTFTLPLTDHGPNKRTGRGIDITAAAANQMGYTSKNFPTDKPFSYRRIDDVVAGRPPDVSGNVNVTVNSNGTAAKVAANSDGMFQGTKVTQHRQMQPTSQPAARLAAGTAAL
jgi:murein DD-endopeptidase MepM/ murein hydrolase activator NlpD